MIPAIEGLDAWMWKGQAASRSDWPQITTNRGTPISIAPRQYIVQFRQRSNATALDTDQLTALMAAIVPTHDYRFAPEPLNVLPSHLQLLVGNETDVLFLSLTNISSQLIRRKLFRDILDILGSNYVPTLMWIFTGNQQTTPKTYSTPTSETVLDVLLLAQAKLVALEVSITQVPPWFLRMRVVLHHEASNKIDAVMPDRRDSAKLPTRQELDAKRELKSLMIKRALRKRQSEVRKRMQLAVATSSHSRHGTVQQVPNVVASTTLE